MEKKQMVEQNGPGDFHLDKLGGLCFRGRLWVPKNGGLREAILVEGHSGKFAMHPGGTKMYRDLRESYWWPGLKRDVSEFVAKCLTCQQIKAKRQVPSGLLQPIQIPQWKWEKVTMDFVIGLPLTPKKNNAAWVIVDRLTKSAHFVPIRTDFPLSKLAKLYIAEIVRLHVFQNPSSPIEIRVLPPSFGRVFKRLLAPNFVSAPLFTPRLMVSPNESSKF